MRQRVDFRLDHGTVEGMYVFPAHDAGPLVIITNGHNGFWAYGMFPYIQDALAEKGIASYSYNFSHGGVRDGEDYFTDLEAYRKNCMRLEKQDLEQILLSLASSPLEKHQGAVFLLSHSLGSVPVIFAARETLRKRLPISGIVMMAPIRTLDVFPRPMMVQWKQQGVYYMRNNRTEQELPQGREFLDEVLASGTRWNVERALKETPTRYLLIHGGQDEDVPLEHSNSLQAWAKEAGYDVSLRIIDGAGHTFNTTHPFKCRTPELDAAIDVIVEWVTDQG